jgi:hypothetical protein
MSALWLSDGLCTISKWIRASRCSDDGLSSVASVGTKTRILVLDRDFLHFDSEPRDDQNITSC